jgi:peptidoglycan/LPS O-acetylase OafA/YrhL
VLSVVGAHALGRHIDHFWTSSVGRIGVFLFFVHTCCVLMYSLDRQRAEDESELARRFYLRRAFRIYPLAVVTVLAIGLLPTTVGAPLPPAGQWLANLTLTTNIAGYFNLLPTLWSLPLELQMYIALPLLFISLPRLKVRGILALWAFAVVVAMIQTRYVPILNGRLEILWYVPHFVPGILAYQLRTLRPRWSGRFWVPALLAICATFYALERQPSFRYINAHEPIFWVLSLTIGATLCLFEPMKPSWITRMAKHVATYSFGIYLWHYPAFWLIDWLNWPRPLEIVVWCGTVLVLSWASYKLIEHPMIQVGDRLLKPRHRLQPDIVAV